MGIHCWGEGLEKQTLAQGIINRSDFSTHIYQCFKLKFHPNSILTVLGNSHVSWFSNKQKGILSFFIKNALFPGTRPLHHLIYWVFHNKVNLVSSSTFSLSGQPFPQTFCFLSQRKCSSTEPLPPYSHIHPLPIRKASFSRALCSVSVCSQPPSTYSHGFVALDCSEEQS